MNVMNVLNRKIVFALLCFLLLTMNVIAQPLENGNFEQWNENVETGPPDGWVKDTSGAAAKFSASREDSVVFSGGYSVNLTWSTDQNCDLKQIDIMPIVPNEYYKFSVWLYDNDPDGKVRVYVRWEDSEGLYITNSAFSEYSSDGVSWQELSTGYVLSPPDVVQCEVRIRCYDESSWDGEAAVYVDDATFEIPSGEPRIVAAYSINTLDMIVLFNMNVDETSAETISNYELSDGVSTVTFSDAQWDGADNRKVTLSGASSSSLMGDAELDTLVVNNIEPEGGGVAGVDVEFAFFAGITPISLIQETGLDLGNTVTISAIVTAEDKVSRVWVADDAGAWNGVMVYDFDFDGLVAEGDEILLCAKISEYHTMTELIDPTLIDVVSSGNETVATVITCADLDNDLGQDELPAEQWEGCLVKILDAEIVSGPTEDFEYTISDNNNAHQVVISDDAWYNLGGNSLVLIARYNVSGVVTFTDTPQQTYKLNPRSMLDLHDLTTEADQWYLLH